MYVSAARRMNGVVKPQQRATRRKEAMYAIGLGVEIVGSGFDIVGWDFEGCEDRGGCLVNFIPGKRFTQYYTIIRTRLWWP